MEPDLRTQLGTVLYTRHSLVVALVCVSLIAACLTLANLYLVWRSGEIYYTVLGAGVRASRPGEVPHEAIEDLSLAVIMRLGNNNAAGMDSAVQAVMRWFTGHLRQKFLPIMDLEIQYMRESDITMRIQNPVISRIEQVYKGTTSVYQTYVTADRFLSVGAEDIDPHQVEIMIECYPVVVEESNIYGLWINDMHWPRINMVEGEIAEVKATQSNGHRKRKSRRSNSIVGQQ